MVKQVFVSSIRLGWWSPMTSHVVWIGLQPAIALSHNGFFFLYIRMKCDFSGQNDHILWKSGTLVGDKLIYIYIYYTTRILATRTAILTVHEDSRWWSARNLCGRFLSADLPPSGTLLRYLQMEKTSKSAIQSSIWMGFSIAMRIHFLGTACRHFNCRHVFPGSHGCIATAAPHGDESPGDARRLFVNSKGHEPAIIFVILGK